MTTWRFHPDHTAPTGAEIFVFGSNLAGKHDGGAARVASQLFGALHGMNIGPMGRAFAIPTVDEARQALPLARIRRSVELFLEHARRTPEHFYFVTRVGCGVVGRALGRGSNTITGRLMTLARHDERRERAAGAA